jgi:hypothetical protein
VKDSGVGSVCLQVELRKGIHGWWFQVVLGLQCRNPLSLWPGNPWSIGSFFPMLVSLGVSYDPDQFRQDSIPLFLLVFYKVGIGNCCLRIVWPGLTSLSCIVQGLFDLDMDNLDWKEIHRILCRHEEITHANNNAFMHISSKITKLEQANITNTANIMNLLLSETTG